MLSMLLLSILSSFLSLVTSSHLTSLQVCHHIRDNRIKILSMGSRGYRDGAHNHWVYLLAEGGYLFVVPFANLKVNASEATENKLIIGDDYIDASTLFNVNAQTLTATGQVRYQKFSFITNKKEEHFLMRLYGPTDSYEKDCFELYRLVDGVKSETPCKEGKMGDWANFLLSMDSTVKAAEHPDQGTMFKVWGYEVFKASKIRLAYEYEVDGDKIKFEGPYQNYPTAPLSLPYKNILTAFSLIVNDSATMILLSDGGQVIIGQRQHLYSEAVGFVTSVEQPLSDFIECVMSDKIEVTTSPNDIPSKSIVSNSYDLQWWTLLAASATGIVVVLCGWILYRWFKKKKKNRKDRTSTRKPSKHNSNGIESVNTSQADTSSRSTSNIKTSSNISNIASKISSMLVRSAKSTNKAKKCNPKANKKNSKKSKANKQSPKR